MTEQVKSLYRLDPPNETRSAEQVAQEVIGLYKADFNITIDRLCQILSCERSWVAQFILPEVQHIFITHFFGQYIAERFASSLTPEAKTAFEHRMYFLSRKSLVSFYRSHATAEQKTKMVDITLYRDPSATLSDLLSERDRHASAKASAAEKKRHLERMSLLLTGEGYILYESSLRKDKEWQKTPLPILSFDPDADPFITSATAAKKYHLHSNTSVYNYMERHGAVRIRLGGKILWHIPEYMGAWLVPCPYSNEKSENALMTEKL